MADDPDGYADTYELQVPIFVLTHTPPAVAPKRNERLFSAFVTDGVESAVAPAGERDVTVVGGVDLDRQLLAAGLVFDGTPPVALEEPGVDDVGARTGLRFRVLRSG
jgi:hypothetical protein